MKRLILLGGLAFVSTLFIISSCKKEEKKNLPPTINFVQGLNYVSSDTTIGVSTVFIVSVYAEANAESKSNIRTLKVTREFGTNSADTTFNFDNSSITANITFNAQSIVGVETITFDVTDNDGQKASASLQITTVITAGKALPSKNSAWIEMKQSF